MPSGTFGVPNNSLGLTTEVRWRTEDDSSNNRSNVIVELWAIRSSSTTFGTGSFVIRIGNDGTVGDGGVSVGTSWVRVASRSRLVNHNADGSLSIQIGIVSGGKDGTSWTSTGPEYRTVALTDYVRLPSAPGTPSVTSTGTDRVGLSWSAPSAVGGGILEYQVQRATNSGFTSGTATFGGSTSLSRLVTGLNPGTTYFFRVRARNNDGWGAWSGTRSQSTAVAAASAPGTPSVSNIGPTSLDLAWAAPSNLGGGTLSGYRVQRATNSAFTQNVVTTDGGTARTRAITGLTPGVDYWFRVAALNEAGVGAYSGARTARTLSGAYVSDGSTWVPCEVFVSDGSSDQSGEVYVSDGVTYQAAG